MVLELMPCATHSRLWCGFDADSSRLPSPFPSLLISVDRLPLLSLVSHSIICSSFALLPSTILLQHILTTSVIALRPFALYFTSLRVDGSLRKVRDSNPRIVLTIAALAVRCLQPDSANLPYVCCFSSGLLSRSLRRYCIATTALHLHHLQVLHPSVYNHLIDLVHRVCPSCAVYGSIHVHNRHALSG